MAVHVIVAHWEHFHPDILPSPLLLPRRGTGIIHAPSDRIKPATVMSQCCHGSPAWHKRTMAGASWSSRSIWPSMYGELQLTRLWQDCPRSLSQWERGEKHDDSIGVLPFACQNDTMGGPFMPRAAVSKKGGEPHPRVQKLFKERSDGGNGRFHGSRVPSYLWPVSAGEGAGPPVAGPRGDQRAPAL